VGQLSWSAQVEYVSYSDWDKMYGKRCWHAQHTSTYVMTEEKVAIIVVDIAAGI